MNDIKTWQERAQDLGHDISSKRWNKAFESTFKGDEIAELREALAARATPAQPDAYEQRAMRIGKHVLEFANCGGWKDDGEGAFEFIQRHSYAVGFEDAGGKLSQFGTHPVNRWPIAAITAGLQPSPSSVGAAIRSFALPKPDTHCFDDDTKKDVWSHSPDQVRELLSEAAALAEQHQIPMTYVGTLALGCVDGDELSEWDIEPDNKAIDALQLELVRTTADVYMCLYAVPFSADPSIAQDGRDALLLEAADFLWSAARMEQSSHDSPPEPFSEWDNDALVLSNKLRSGVKDVSLTEDALRYRHLRNLMRFSSSKLEAPTMTLSAPLDAPEHDPHTDWMAERFDESVDRTVDASIAAHNNVRETEASNGNG